VSIVVIGVNHRTGPLAVLERVAVADDALPKVLHGIVSRQNVNEAVVLATCNRTEVYAVAERFHGAYADIRDALCELGGIAPDELLPHIYSQHDEAAVAHLFEVAAGLDSAVIGESEILGQVRVAWERAQSEGSARSALNLLFRHALEVGKRARTETAIGRATASVSHAAVEMAQDRIGSVEGRRILVVGAGEMGEGTAVALAAAGAAHVTVMNRSAERGERLAARVQGAVRPFTELGAALADADVVVTCTGAGTTVVGHDLVRDAMAQRSDRPLLIVDIAVPRDVESSVATVPGVTLLDLDDLRDWAAHGLAARVAEADQVRSIVGEEVERYLLDVTSRQAAPLVAQLHERAEDIRIGELERHARRLEGLDPAAREAVESLTRGIVAKLLHHPSVRLRTEAGTPQGERNAAAVRDLFDLG
jgi:glutamyl-tRNA reductase